MGLSSDAPAPMPSALPARTAARPVSIQEVTEGGQVATLALGNVLLELISASGSVGLEGQVVVGDLLVVTLDHLEELVTSALNMLGDLDQDGALGAGEVLAGTVSGTLGTGLTHLDGADDLLVKVSVHGIGLGLDEGTILGGGGLLVADETSEASEQRLGLAVVGRHSVGEGGETSTEGLLGLEELSTSASGVGCDAARVAGVAAVGAGLHAGELAVHLLGGTSEVLGSILGVASSLGADSGDSTLGRGSEGLDLLSGSTLVLIEE